MSAEIIAVALVIAGFVVGMTFTPSDPWMLLASGMAAIGWTLAAWFALTRRETRGHLEDVMEDSARLWREKLKLERELEAERRRVKITPVSAARRKFEGLNGPVTL